MSATMAGQNSPTDQTKSCTLSAVTRVPYAAGPIFIGPAQIDIYQCWRCDRPLIILKE